MSQLSESVFCNTIKCVYLFPDRQRLMEDHQITNQSFFFMLSSYRDDVIQVDYHRYLSNESRIFPNGSTTLLHRN